jgi:hypothetical protein
MGEWRYSSAIFYLCTRWRWVVSFTPRPLYPRGKSSWCLLYRRLGGPQGRSGHCGIYKNPLPLPETEPRMSCSPTLYRLSYPNNYLIPLSLNVFLKITHILNLWCERKREHIPQQTLTIMIMGTLQVGDEYIPPNLPTNSHHGLQRD